ncbi:MAG: aminotransferase class I/II-fold pyridoxal phosphate-dependent enzyme, partial [Acidobacteria bacterium]|nr:aminotransferase class I/II-fold pyridoxal phosphate-dependent enzyme [Acidobacteriota bacterium]
MKQGGAVPGVKQSVLDVPAYTLRAREAEVKLNQNENPYDFPADLKEEVFRRFRERSWSRYPEFVPEDLRQLLADFAGWRRDGLLVGNGSNELLQAALMTLVEEGAAVAIPVPTFTVYGLLSKILGARLVPIRLRPDLKYDAEEIIRRAQESSAKLLIVATPNNPTGAALDPGDLRRILESFSGHVLLDEAYFEFCGITGLPLLGEYPRLIITRTFSKALGMAGLRIGYLMA